MLVLVEDVREAGARLLELDPATRLQLAAEIQEQLRDLGAPVELGLDPGEGASALPECALLARTALGMALGDQLDRAQRAVVALRRLHAARVRLAGLGAIGARADPAAETYGACDDAGIDAFDLDTRRHVYFSVVANGRPPTVAETAALFARDEEEIADAYLRLHDAHALVLFPDSTNVWMANPFCFAPTPHRVTAGGRVWTGACAWDALGIPGAFHGDGLVESECACCGERLELEVVDGELTRGRNLLVHFLVPAKRWWDDIGYT